MPTNSEARKGIKTEEGALMVDKAFQLRSEERRVGKERRTRWSPEH